MYFKDERMSPFSTGGTSTSQSINDMSSIALRVSRSLLDTSPSMSIEDLHAPNEYCPFGEEEEVIQCDSNQLRRSYDGTCNNLQFGWWGKSETYRCVFIRVAISISTNTQIYCRILLNLLIMTSH